MQYCSLRRRRGLSLSLNDRSVGLLYPRWMVSTGVGAAKLSLGTALSERSSTR